MKKILAILSVVILVGCSTDDVNEGESIEDESGSEAESENVGENEQSFFENHRGEMPELRVVEEEIGTDFDEVHVPNDNEGSRVILYENDGIPAYKSVYIKEDQRLKIINTKDQDEDDGLIYEAKVE
ncbi:hypothetical protein KFZ56_02375 [Virgibacillus sp. NKC19-3]|uniref:hypothetical protein n=1 Tax=Virgibacillus saliphilus TaxID=2831674 RepID=UPI001C9B7F85|nr:hypothetical protein [Virgibacillus sp. NKC19-3]MBY7141950.1 hypothetical protein [Virgibacillus sp. NKC19-3]